MPTEVYLSSSKQHLSMIEVSISQIESMIGKYRSMMDRRKNARRLAVVLTICSFAFIDVMAVYANSLGISDQTTIPIISIPFAVVMWSFIGSQSAMLNRFNKSDDA